MMSNGGLEEGARDFSDNKIERAETAASRDDNGEL
jgi:hypothetical protein